MIVYHFPVANIVTFFLMYLVAVCYSAHRSKAECKHCHGTGVYKGAVCPFCHGTGK